MKLSRKQVLKIMIALILNSLSVVALSQDTIVMRNGTTILAKVMEVSVAEVKFKKAENLSGPLYVEKKSGIAKIVYSNGIKDEFNPQEIIPDGVATAPAPLPAPYVKIYPHVSRSRGAYFYGDKLMSEDDLQSTLQELKNPEIDLHVRRARISRGLQNIGFVALPLAVLGNWFFIHEYDNFFVYNSSTNNQFKKTETCFGLAALCVAGTIYFKIDRSRNNAAAVKMYNEQYGRPVY